MASDHQRILILCKTYPSPSARYVETSCVAGMTDDGRLIRLFPVPFRLVEDDQQFKKWQWITARVRRAQDDARTESHRVSVDTIEVEAKGLGRVTLSADQAPPPTGSAAITASGATDRGQR